MSYQVLARKWRPKSFEELVGQHHVLQALTGALAHNRLHHAYLFTGTRGVGKTTIARIFARCLNCEQGLNPTPCGQCDSCREITEGRFVDLIEIDAASRTKVEDTREILENVQYAPVRGRYKVYLIDEVHMLSLHSFNALLKTLEEPPAHVKFLLATTDPQKLPITILSRCLQFNLKNMPASQIVTHLIHVLNEENIPFEKQALWQIAQAADGSMRDALSLTDQAIAFCHQTITAENISALLGTVDRQNLIAILEALYKNDANLLLAASAQLAEQAIDFNNAINDILSLLHQVAIAQLVPDAIDNYRGDKDQILELARRLSTEEVQLFYQSALVSRRDMSMAPDGRTGFEMALLRMLSFRPAISPPAGKNHNPGNSENNLEKNENTAADNAQVTVKTDLQPPENNQNETSSSCISETGPAAILPDHRSSDTEQKLSTDRDQPAAAPAEKNTDENKQFHNEISDTPPQPSSVETEQDASATAKNNSFHVASQLAESYDIIPPWYELLPQLQLGGVTGALAAHSVLDINDTNNMSLTLDDNYDILLDDIHCQRIAAALSRHMNRNINLKLATGTIGERETPVQKKQREAADLMQAAKESITNSPQIFMLIESFNARVLTQSIKPLKATGSA